MSIEDSQVSAGQRVLGDVAGEGNLVILGRLEGAIHIGGQLTVGADALVLADIVASSVSIEGRVEGRVRAAGEVTIGHRGVLIGNVEGLLHVEEGGVFQGRLLGSPGTGHTGEALPAVLDEEPPVASRATEDVASQAGLESQPARESGPIRRLTADDTFPPGPAPIEPSRNRDQKKLQRPDEVTKDGRREGVRAADLPDTRKQAVRTDTEPEQAPPPQVRSSRPGSKPDLGDPWFEDQDYLVDSK